MIQTNRAPVARRVSQASGVVGIARADMRLDVGDGDARAFDEAAGRLDARLECGEVSLRLQRVARRDQPPDAVEAEASSAQSG